jgi:ABC-2 type transport system permease protein
VIESRSYPRSGALLEEIRKFPAFFRRDLLVAWSYRLAFAVDWINLLGQIVVFALVGRLVSPSAMPIIGGVQVTYVEFVVTGIALTTLLQIALGRVVNAMREEQLMGTLEALLMTPTSQWTVQLGLVVYDLVYVPIRTILLFVIAALFFDLRLHLDALGPLTAILIAFIPFAWGIGMVGAGLVLTFRRGVNILTIATSALMIGSNAYFPVTVLPEWIQTLTRFNPITVALNGVRGVLIAGNGWEEALHTVVLLIPVAIVSLLVGVGAVRRAIARERRQGTLGLY